jgi:DNA-binding NtrC family response regulator
MEKILLVGYLTDLVERRKQCLEAAAYDVTCATSFSEVMRLIDEREFKVVVLGHGVPEIERNRIARKTKQVSPSTKLVMLYLASIKNAELADAIIHTTTDPADLARTIQYLTRQQTRTMSGT